jgi:hypothetical protein
MQVFGQLMPTGLLVTVPLPVIETVNWSEELATNAAETS